MFDGVSFELEPAWRKKRERAKNKTKNKKINNKILKKPETRKIKKKILII